MAHSGLTTEHYRVGTFHYSIGHVGYFTTVRACAVYHALHHLCGYDHRFCAVYTFTDDVLLYHRHLLQRQLYAQVATGYHNGIRCKYDLAEMFQCFGLFYLGDDLGVAVLAFQYLAQLQYIIGPAHK